ncbi:disease resistance protein At4g27190 isoform X2 [Ziziphus jujuba]|uniref:Disease resistance protein At4g27190 isoform X1 n=1 Tax=Ziziphus jujuba TaxID=326968 RepID=A0ABM3ZTC8_ZIZJJ|nr:disease resistance protein At4g27190 isoform X1 [Ziziphus jujuba]XP_060667727.1 disease resistance protein At4g27190 isoform X2 [Ziziphus jujuba]XP_060667728.1 disease resistance protein At4g27190 isoform X1 [Ziziphus jujuba]XP_060667729.1 disease resistance protein At4g27190 isoform X2 [Ziziphus jujuba]
MDVVIAIVAKIAEYTVAPVGRQIGYVFSYGSNMENLDSVIRQLEHKKNRLQHSVDEAKNNAHEIEADVQEWLDRVPAVTEEARNFRRDECRANTRCLNVSFPNPVRRHRLSRKAKKMVQSITSEILVAEGFGEKVSYLPTRQSSIRNKGYEEFESRMSTLRKVMEALRDPNVNMIGLYGMGGVGKTMLAKEVARKAMEEKLFSQAILVTVSQYPDYKSIQQQIAGELGLTLDDRTSLSARADRLRSRLRQEKRILMVVDDVWKRIDLDEDVGISFGGDQNQCKILLTSRFYNALKNDVRNESTFEVGKLSGSESMDLFNKTATDDSDGKPEFPDLATQIVKECAGLPLAITVVASALKKEPNCHVWKNALDELRRARPDNIEGMHDKVYSSVKLSYNFLPSEEAKSLLLLCSLFPEDENIDTGDLLKYAFGLDLLQGPFPEMETAKSKMNTLVENLKRSSLLLEGSYGKDRVKLHDVIRDVAIDIASKERRWYNIRNRHELVEYMRRRDHKNFKDAIAISLLSCTDVVEQLPDERLECPQLKLLLIAGHRRGPSDCQIADRFLEGLKELRVLYLSYVNLDPLPSSFRFLQNLRTLRLDECRLGNIALIGELKNLEILDLSSSIVVELGSEIGQLTRLRVLDLRRCEGLSVIQPNVLGSLRNLEWLNLSSWFENWEVEGKNGRERRNASLSELKNLPQLSSLLDLTIPDVNVLPKDIFGEKLESFSINLGRIFAPSTPGSHRYLASYYRKLSMDLERSSQLDELGRRYLLKGSEAIEINGLEGMNSVAYELDKDGFPHCKHLQVANNAGILYIVNSVGQTAFRKLEILELQRLVKLEKICHGILSPDSFRNLRRLDVTVCHRLKNIFCFSIAKLLEEIKVKNCEMIEEIVDNDEAINVKIEFPRLRSLRLENLPQLLQYCTDRQPKSTTNTSSIPLFNEKVEFSNLELLKLFSLNIGKVWSDQLQYYQKTFVDQGAFGNLKEIEVSECDNLKALIPLSLATSLVHLQDLNVGSCEVMEEIVYSTEDSGEEIRLENILFPKLEYLSLGSIPKLGTIIRDSKSTRIDNEAEGINSVAYKQPLFNSKVEFSNLGFLILFDLNIGRVWSDQLQYYQKTFVDQGAFGNLRNIEVSGCDNLKALIPLSLATSLVHLVVLNVGRCKVMEEIVYSTEESGEEIRLENILFPKLEFLSLSSIPKLGTIIRDSKSTRIDNEAEGIDSVAYKQPLFTSKVEFRNMEELYLESLDSLQMIWDTQLLEKFDNNLTKVIVTRCDNLKSLIPSSLCGSLVHLDCLEISGCESIREVVSIEESAGQEKFGKIFFPQLKSLVLYDLPELKRFCAGDCIECPSLKELAIKNCGKMETFISDSLPSHIDNENEEIESVNKTPFFVKDKVKFPNLEALTIRSNEVISEIWHDDQSSTLPFPKLKSIKLDSILSESCKFSFKFFQRLEHLDHVGISSLLMESIISSDEAHDIPMPLRKLDLDALPKLVHLCDEGVQTCKTFRVVEVLNVSRCERLKSLMTSSMCFQNLTTLSVSDCDALENLMASAAAAKSLQQLTEMKVRNCKRMTQIIGNNHEAECDVETEQNEIGFSNLQILTLHDLCSLGKFYSGNNIIRLPNLEELIVNKCPEMGTFSHGTVYTPRLYRITIKLKHDWLIDFPKRARNDEVEYQRLLEGDVNRTLKKHWEDHQTAATSSQPNIT